MIDTDLSIWESGPELVGAEEMIEAENMAGPTYGYGAAYSTVIENIGPGRSDSGEIVTPDTVLGLPTAWESVSKITGALAGMPCEIKKRTAGGEEIRPEHPVAKLLNCNPNEWQTPFTFREVLFAHALIQGNGRARIFRNSLRQPVSLQLLFPWHTYTVIMEGEKFHATYTHPEMISQETIGTSPGYYTNDPGEFRNGIELLHDDDVFHVPGLSYNGFWGMHLTQVLANALGLAISAQARVGGSFNNQGMPGFLIELPLNIFNDPKKRAEFRAEWEAAYRGPRNAGKMQLLPAGFKAHAAQMTANDAQLNELSGSMHDIIRRIFLMPPDDGSAYKSITERNTQFINQTLGRWMKKFEQEVWTKLLSERERMALSHRAKFNTSELVKGDPNTWAEYTGKLRQQSVINGNEAREMHGLNAVDDESLESYGNPNITTATDAAAAEQVDASEPEETTAETADEPNTENRAVRLHFRKMLNREISQVKKAASYNDFEAWATKWYETYRSSLRKICDEIGIDRAKATALVERSLDDLAFACAIESDTERAAQIRSVADSWENQKREELF